MNYLKRFSTHSDYEEFYEEVLAVGNDCRPGVFTCQDPLHGDGEIHYDNLIDPPIKCLFNVTSISYPTRIMSNEAFGKEYFTKVIVDGTEVEDFIDYYQFEEPGEHTVLYFMADNKVVKKGSFKNCGNIKSFSLPNTVEVIEEEAFNDCDDITVVNIQENVKKIGDSAFEGCNKIREINIPDTLSELGYTAFPQAGNGSSPWWKEQPDGVVYVGNVAFAYKGTMPSNTSITLRDGTIGIAADAFGAQTKLISVTIPDGCVTIGLSAFEGCTKLSSITIPDSVMVIKSYAFQDTAWRDNQDEGLVYAGKVLYECNDSYEEPTAITISAGTKSIAEWSFYELSNITSVTIPSSVEYIGPGTFYGCDDIEVITVDPNNQYYDSRNNCNAVIETSTNTLLGGCKTTIIPSGTKIIGEGAFGELSLTDVIIPDGVEMIDDSAFDSCNQITALTIPNSVKEIGAYAFNQCKGITSVNIPGNVGYGAFYWCTSLTSVTFSDNVVFIDERAFQRSTNIAGPLIFPEKTSYIGDSAFSGCSKITEVVCSPNMKVVGNGSFYGVTGLTSVSLNEGLAYIFYNAFYNCRGITSVHIPSTVYSIPGNPFIGCYNISQISVHADNAYYNSYNNCNAIINTSANTLIVGCKNTVIPETVTKLSGNSFSNCTGLTSIVIPNSIQYIDSTAFVGCTNLTALTMSSGVTSVGGFSGCTKLKNVVLQEGNTSLTVDAFSKCTSLSSITLPDSITDIGTRAFSGCSQLSTIDFGNGVENIQSDAFNGTPWLTNQPDGVVYAGKCLYKYKGTMPANTTITVESGTISISHGAFSGYTNLVSVVLAEEVKTIAGYAFYGCSGLQSIYLGRDFQNIYSSDSFKNCSSISSVTINSNTFASKNSTTTYSTIVYFLGSQVKEITFGNNVEQIGDYICSGLTNLSSVTVSNNLCGIGVGSFSGTSWMNSLPSGLNYLGHVAFNYKGTMAANTSLSLSAGTLGVAASAFSGQSNLISVDLPNGIKYIGRYSFQNCGITQVSIPSSVETVGMSAFSSASLDKMYFTSLEHICQIKSDSSVAMVRHIYVNGSEITSLVIPNTVTDINSYSFANCPYITSITINSNVTSIGDGAFQNCSGITSITIPNSVTNIGSNAFQRCYELASVTLSNNITDIAQGLFFSCSGLTSITIPNSVTSIGNSAFYGCSGLTSITIPDSVTNIGASVFSNCVGLTALTIPSGVTSIGTGLTQYCVGLERITVDSNNTSYDSRDNCNAIIQTNTGYLYAGCKNTKFVNGLTRLMGYSMAGLTIESVNLPDSITYFVGYAFYSCKSLSSVTLGNNVENLNDYAFGLCTALTSFTCTTVTPPTIYSATFSSVPATCPFYVPAQSVDAYKAAANWSARAQYIQAIP